MTWKQLAKKIAEMSEEQRNETVLFKDDSDNSVVYVVSNCVKAENDLYETSDNELVDDVPYNPDKHAVVWKKGDYYLS